MIAEKLQSIVAFGMANTRLKDFYDLVALIATHQFDSAPMVEQVRATFERRKTPIPTETPVGLTNEFAADRAKKTQWTAFLTRNRLDSTRDLSEVAAQISAFAMPVFGTINNGSGLGTWPKTGPCSANDKAPVEQ